MEEITQKVSHIEITKNKGTGAGGKNTTLNGGAFEKITSIEALLLEKEFTKKNFLTAKDYYMEKNVEKENKKLIYVKQWGLKTFMEEFYASSATRKPDEAFIIIEKVNGQDKLTISILEKKYQARDGSADLKLWAGCALKREYEIYYENKHKINYSFSLSKFLINKINSGKIKWVILKKILKEHDINVFNPLDSDYFNQVINWGFPCLKSDENINCEIKVVNKKPNKKTKKLINEIEV